MKTIYDPKTDSLFHRFSPGQIVESEEISPGIVLDFDADGRILAFEIMRARTNLAASFDFEAAAQAHRQAGLAA